MDKQEAKCPKCGQGHMKMVLPLASQVPAMSKEKQMQAKCNKCGFEEDYVKVYPYKPKP
jgi:C4-type Zn-finger protein